MDFGAQPSWSESQPCLLPTRMNLAKLLSQTEPQFPRQFHGHDCWSEMRELCQAPGYHLLSLRAEWMDAGPGAQPGSGYVELVLLFREHPGLWSFASRELISPERREIGCVEGSTALTKACCISSAPSTHLVVLTDLKMYPSCLPCSHFRTW